MSDVMRFAFALAKIISLQTQDPGYMMERVPAWYTGRTKYSGCTSMMSACHGSIMQGRHRFLV